MNDGSQILRHREKEELCGQGLPIAGQWQNGLMAEPGRMEIVVITGLSGAGRRSASHTMEDLGWYLVDNLPATLLPELAHELLGKGLTKLAVVLDVRSRSDLENLPAVFSELSPIADRPKIVYLEASDAVIVRR